MSTDMMVTPKPAALWSRVFLSGSAMGEAMAEPVPCEAMGIEREFLGWESPPLETGAAWLLARATRLGPSIDMTGLAVCVPSARAGRVLLNVLAHEAERGGGALLPPVMYTPGLLQRALLEAWRAGTSQGTRAVATPLVRRLAWRAAIEELSGEQKRSLGSDAQTDKTEPLMIASLVARSHGRLGSVLGTFARAWQVGANVHGGTPEPRLHALAKAEALYERMLARAGVSDPEFEFARAVEGSGRGELIVVGPLPFKHLALFGVADMAPSLRLLLRSAGEQPDAARLSALVFAPGNSAEMFDDVGALVIEPWTTNSVDIKDASLTVVDSADELVHAALGIVGELGRLPGGTSTDDVVLGVTDRAIEPLLVRAATRCGVRVRPASGRDALGSPVGVLLAQVRTLLQEPTFRSWGTMLRHGWFGAAMKGLMPDPGPVPIDRLDRYVLEHLPDRLSRAWVKDADADVLSALLDQTMALLGGCAPSLNARGETPRKSLSEWAMDIDALLARVEPRTASGFEDDDDVAESARKAAVRSALEELADVSRAPSLDPLVSCESAISVLLTLLQESTAAPEDIEGAVEAVGWLELAMDPARHVVVMGMNDGLVPSREAPDPLIPPPVLRAMGVDAGDARVARDSYLLSLLGASRRSLFLLACRRSADGDPMLPSRLLFRTGDESLVSRARQWVPQKHGTSVPVPMPPARATAPVSRFKPLAVARLVVPERWRVTAFKDYLASPYLFYLKHVARVMEVEEETSEMLPNLFGSLVHDCLKDFATSADRGSSDESVIARSVRAALARRVGTLFGDSPSVPVWLQTEQARARLEGFAARQAQRAREGWTIVHAEWSPAKDGVAFAWEGGEVRLTGRIDRVDRHPSLGFALLDYKTADTAKTPARTHQRKGDWIDLQLPLYRHLARSVLGDETTPTLAYLNLAADGEATLEEAAWDEAELRGADEKAREVIARVHAGEFGEAGTMPPTSRTLGALAGLGHLGSLEEDEEDEA